MNVFRFLLTFSAISLLVALPTARAELRVGSAQTDITPPLPVALSGQFRLRLAKEIESPVMAAVIALEKIDADGKQVDQAIMVSCDLVAIREGILERVRGKIGKQNIEGLDPRKIFLSATHTHTAPVMREGVYNIPKEGVTTPTEYVEFLAGKVADAVVDAWEKRSAGSVSWGLGHAMVAQNRRIAYHNGTAAMYGKVNGANFKGIEGYEDHGVEVLFFWSGDSEQPSAMAVNVACPAQEVESRNAVNADYWHEVRQSLAEKFGEDLVVLTWVGAAGDQSPHLMLRKAAEARMLKSRGLTRLEEIARRIVAAVDEAYDVAKNDRHDDPVLKHHVADLPLPKRMVTEAELAAAKAEITRIQSGSNDEILENMMRALWNQKTVDRYHSQKNDTVLPMEMHAIRLGDVAICTNQFELYTEYGIRMKARSQALQTFVIQLAGPGTYLATDEAEAGGGYSAIINSCHVGPKGGKFLVDESIKAINAMWE
ncbi:MAG: hypothetical protein HKN23_13580 [Verrucomicrobiales bacterium]|nr:hypothetical protein [Verrucomicrobiales bacterium]